mmetsp:Transcript_55752/g.147271  ORF Transcript_55752/g.147271 Transcript_55752/m.147271 type:complete len:109 (-) Transcript_55752:270-596(-)
MQGVKHNQYCLCETDSSQHANTKNNLKPTSNLIVELNSLAYNVHKSASEVQWQPNHNFLVLKAHFQHAQQCAGHSAARLTQLTAHTAIHRFQTTLRNTAKEELWIHLG